MSKLRNSILRIFVLSMFVAQSCVVAPAASAQTAMTLVNPTSVIECDEHSHLFKGLNIPTYVWSDGAKQPQGIVFGMHGGCLHGSSYTGLGNALAKQGYLVVSTDLRGYGKWHFDHFGTDKDETFNYDQSVSDIESMLRRLRSAYPHTPIYGIGESLGANVALVIANQKPRALDGIILVSPYAHIKMFLSARMLLNVAQVAINPASKINLSPYFRNRLSNRPDRIEEHFDDPLSRDKQSALELIKSIKINHRGLADAMQIPKEIPLLMIVGKKDLLISPKAAIQLFDRLPTVNKQLWLRPESAHLMVETKTIDPMTVSTISHWLDRNSRTTGLLTLRQNESALPND